MLMQAALSGKKKNGRQPLGNNYLSPLGVASLLLVIRKAAPRWRHILVR